MAKREPVILRPIYVGHRGGNIMATHFHPDGVASFENTWSDGYMEHLPLETVKYIPDVGRCETCTHSVVDSSDVEQEPGECFCVADEKYKKLTGFCDEWGAKPVEVTNG